MVDGHMHLENGPICVEYVMEFVNAGLKSGMDTIHILDHTHRFSEFAAMYEPLKAAAKQQKEWFDKKTLEPLQTYIDVIEEMKKMDLPIHVKFGLEVCYAPQDKALIRDVLATYPFDFVIGSIHSIDGLLYDMNGFSKEILWDKYDVDDIYRRYYEIMDDMICSNLFTQIGHPDQLKLFHYEPTYDVRDTYHHLAKLAKAHDIYMEHNTGIHYRYHHEDIGTNETFLTILKAHRVKLITASDAHQPRHVGMYIKEATQMIGE